jgi:signal transduction histidine kinase
MRALGRPAGLSFRMVVASGLLALLLVSAFAILLLAIRDLHQSTQERRETREALVAADELEKLVIDLETGLRGFVITGAEQFLEPWRLARVAVPREAAELEGLVAGDRQQLRRARQIGDAADAYVEEYGLPLLAAVRRGDPAARSITRTETGKRRVDAIRAEFDGFTGAARDSLRLRENSADTAARRATIAGGIGIAASLLLILLFTGYLSRLIVRPVRRAAHMADRLAGGDLSTRMPENDVGEIGMLERSFNTMASSLETNFEQQSALRRVATLVARGVSPSEILDVVTREVGLVSGADVTVMERYETDNTVTAVAAWRRAGEPLNVGRRFSLEGFSLAAMVQETGRSVRVDDFTGATGLVKRAQELGLRAAVACPIRVSGRLFGVIVALSKREAAFPAETETEIADFTELVGTAVANAESRAELAASRARVVAASDETRRRIERNLHDGVQQRLVSLTFELRGAGAAAPEELQEQLARIEEGLVGALDDLREISRGIHPAILSKGGLEVALKSMARRSAVPVELDVWIEGQLPERVEVAAYYVASEALANAAKHAKASAVEVHVAPRDDALQLSISDNGVGGADPGKGSGLVGLSDRVAAVGGTISVRSQTGAGTSLEVRLPMDGDRLPPNSASG